MICNFLKTVKDQANIIREMQVRNFCNPPAQERKTLSQRVCGQPDPLLARLEHTLSTYLIFAWASTKFFSALVCLRVSSLVVGCSVVLNSIYQIKHSATNKRQSTMTLAANRKPTIGWVASLPGPFHMDYLYIGCLREWPRTSKILLVFLEAQRRISYPISVQNLLGSQRKQLAIFWCLGSSPRCIRYTMPVCLFCSGSWVVVWCLVFV
jgi:hypothetical protein